MIVCPQCGKSFPEDESFCASCGYAASKVEPPTTNDATNPYAVGTQLPDSPMPSDLEPRDVPSNVFKAVYQCFNDGGFDGRSSRTEFWFWFFHFLGAVVIPLGVEVLFFYTLSVDVPTTGFVAICFSLIWGAICFIPSLSLCVRRFHDVNLPGIPAYILFLDIALFVLRWCYGLPWRVSKFVETLILIAFPLVAGICLLAILIVALLPGTKGPNRYGPQPINRAAVAEGEAKDNEVSQ